MSPRRLIICAACLCSTAGIASAAQYFAWDPTRTSWTGSSWSSASGGPYTSAWGGYNDAVLEGTGGTVTGGAAVNKWTFNSGGYVLTGGFTMGSPKAVNFIVPNAAHTATITGSLSTANADNFLWKDGAGKLVLGGTNNTYKLVAEQGVLEINGGTTTVLPGGTGAGPGGNYGFFVGADSFQTTTTKLATVTLSGGALNINIGGFFMGQTVNGSSQVAQFTQTAGTVSFSGGGFMGIANGGGVSQLDLSGGSFTSASTMNLGVRGNANLNIAGTAQVTLPSLQSFFSDAVTGSGKTATTNLDGGTLTVNGITRGTSQSTSVLNLNGGTLKAGNNSGNFISVTTANVKAGGAVINTNGFNIGISQPLLDGGGGGGLTKNGSGALTLSGLNTYTGTTTVTAGTLVAGSASALGTGNVSLNGGTLEVPTTLTLSLNLSTALASTLKFDTSTSAITLSGGHYDFSQSGLTFDLNNQFNAPGVYQLIAGGTGNLDFAGTYSFLNGGANNSYSFANGTLTVVPEPSAWMSLLGGYGVLLGLRRCRY